MKLFFLLCLIFCTFSVKSTTPPMCISFCDFVEENVIATRDCPYVIAVENTVKIMPLSDDVALIGIVEDSGPARYVDVDDDDDGTTSNECLPAECGIAGEIAHNPPATGNRRLNDDHDMELVFEDTYASTVTFQVIDWADWNPGSYFETRWTLTAYDGAGAVIGTDSAVRSAPRNTAHRACFTEGILDLTVTAAGIHRVTSVFERRMEDGEWESFSSDPNIAISSICYEFEELPVCSTQDLSTPASACNANGYCVQGEVDETLFGCSCFSGWEGEFCAVESEFRDACVDSEDLSPTSSLFVTDIDGEFTEDGQIVLSITTPVEDNTDDVAHPGNFATYTLHRFLNQDSCDYPEADVSVWTKDFHNTDCTERYNVTTPVADLLQCTGTEDVRCYNGVDGPQIECTPSLCTNPPCSRCYPGQVLSTRGYVRTSLNGLLTDTATAENCHYFEVCLPWIQEIDTSVIVVDRPDFAEQFVVTRVAFRCFNDLTDPDCYGILDPELNWIVQIKTATTYPFMVIRETATSGALTNGVNDYELVSITEENSGDDVCGVSGQCYQTFEFSIPGCDSLEELAVYDITGLVYDCGDSQECTDVKEALTHTLDVVASVNLQATQENCGADISIDATETLDLTMSSFLSDYTEENRVFIEDEETLGFAYFKITAETNNVPITSMSIITLESTDSGVQTVQTGYTVEDDAETCPDSNDLCFKIAVADIVTSTDSDLVVISLRATIEVQFVEGTKRSIGLSTSHQLEQSVRVLTADTVIEDTAEGSSTITTFSLFFVLMNMLF